MKKHRNNIFIVIFTLLLLITNLDVQVMAAANEKLSIPNHTIVTVSDDIINEIEYGDSILEVKRISTSIGPGYSLELEKDYPEEQNFEFVGKAAREVVGIMASGYPNKSATEIGVSSEEDAYFVTQMAVWCVTEGYSPYKFKSKDKVLLKAIKNIYEEGMQYKGSELNHVIMEYYFNDWVQRIVVYIDKDIR